MAAARSRAADYESTAQHLRLVALEVIESAGLLGRSLPGAVLSGGVVKEVLDDALGVIVQQCRSVAAELDHLAAEAIRRAAVCRQYESAWSAYALARDRWRAVATDGAPPIAPPVPARWVR